MIRLPYGTEMNPDLLADLIAEHKALVASTYRAFYDAYCNDYEIFTYEQKPKWKPDNRISANFARYIVDTAAGFFVGIPVTVHAEDTAADEYIQKINDRSYIDDINLELAKMTSIYGTANEMYYLDEKAQIRIAPISPLESFMVYDDSIVSRPMFFIRYYQNSEGVEEGSFSDGKIVQYFALDGGYRYRDEPFAHGFDGVPAVEYIENTERIGLLKNVLPLINAYNKALSEKANDVDYFSDAYLKVIGAKVEENDLKFIRDNRLISFEGAEHPDVGFLERPAADGTQENLFNRLEQLIYKTSMVADVSDLNFGTASGIAIKYKLWAMSSEAKTKQNKFMASMNERYRLIFSHPTVNIPEAAADEISYVFTQNFPANLAEEADIAKALQGIVSEETQLSILSVVDDVQKEIERKAEDAELDTLGFIAQEQ